MKSIAFITPLLLIHIMGCEPGPKEITEMYLQAVVIQDSITLRELSCDIETPDFLDWRVYLCEQTEKTPINFMNKMETIQSVMDTTLLRCENLKHMLLNNYIEITEEEVDRYIHGLKTVSIDSSLTPELRDAMISNLSSFLRFPSRGRSFRLPTGEEVSAQEALIYVWETIGLQYYEKKWEYDFLLFHFSKYESIKRILECVLGHPMGYKEQPTIEETECVLDLTVRNEADVELKRKYKAHVMRAQKGKWLVTGLEEL